MNIYQIFISIFLTWLHSRLNHIFLVFWENYSKTLENSQLYTVTNYYWPAVYQKWTSPLSYSRVFLKVFPKATLKSDTLTLSSYTKSMNQSIDIWMMEQWAFSGTWFTYLQIWIMKIAIPHLYFVMSIKKHFKYIIFFWNHFVCHTILTLPLIFHFSGSIAQGKRV